MQFYAFPRSLIKLHPRYESAYIPENHGTSITCLCTCLRSADLGLIEIEIKPFIRCSTELAQVASSEISCRVTVLHMHIHLKKHPKQSHSSFKWVVLLDFEVVKQHCSE